MMLENKQHDLEYRILTELAKQKGAGEEQKYYVSWADMESHLDTTDQAVSKAWADGFTGPKGLLSSPDDGTGLWFVPVFDPVLPQ